MNDLHSRHSCTFIVSVENPSVGMRHDYSWTTLQTAVQQMDTHVVCFWTHVIGRQSYRWPAASSPHRTSKPWLLSNEGVEDVAFSL